MHCKDHIVMLHTTRHTGQDIRSRLCFGHPGLLFLLILCELIRAHSKIPNCEKPINYFARMLGFGRAGFGVLPDEYTYTFLVTSCSHRNSSLLGEIVHGLAKVLDGMPVRDVFSWTSLLGGFTKPRGGREGFRSVWQDAG
ncbi:hypothetical protein AKJ16_DCAP16360 [Drosera capensis]